MSTKGQKSSKKNQETDHSKEFSELQKKLASCQSTVEKQKATMATYKKDTADLNKQITQQKKELNERKIEIEVLRDGYVEKSGIKQETIFTLLEDTVKKLELQLRDLKRADNGKSHSSTCTPAQKETRKPEDQVPEKSSKPDENVATLQNKIQNLESDVKRLRDTENDLNCKIKKLEDQNKENTSALAKSRAEKGELDNKLKKVSEEVDRYKNKVPEILSQRPVMTSSQGADNNLQNKITKQLAEIENLTCANKRLSDEVIQLKDSINQSHKEDDNNKDDDIHNEISTTTPSVQDNGEITTLRKKLEDAEKSVKELEVQHVQAKSKATEQQDAKEKAEQQISELRFKINEMETKLKRTQEDYKEASTSAENKYKELEKSLNEKERQITELKTENKDIKALKEKYEKQADDKANERVSASAKEDRTRFQEKLNEKDAELKRVQSKLNDLQSLTNETFTKKDEVMRKLQDDLKAAREELNKLRDSTANFENERTKLQDELKRTTQQKDEAIQQLSSERAKPGLSGGKPTKDESKQLQEARKEIDDLKNRLSKVVGAKISDDNPNITDLSDENRPTKLSEKYSELYDNEWTDAYEAIESDEPSEIRIIERLYSTLIDVNQFCKETSVKYTENIMKSVMTLNGGHVKDTQIDVTRRRQLKDLKKTFAPNVTKDVLDRFKKTGKCAAKLEKFYTKCVEICWLMSVQDPPVVIDTTDGKGGAFNGDRYRTYTRTGKTMDYVVWPPLLLHNGGPMLTKGVAQAK